MCRKFGGSWMECRNPIDLMDRPSNMEISLCWYKVEATRVAAHLGTEARAELRV